jgi:hypothetical protein
MQLKQKLFEEEKVLNVSSKDEFIRVVREILPSLMRHEERERFLSVDKNGQDEYISRVLSEGGIKAVRL